MIRTTSVLILILFSFFSYSQSLINENFESWIDNTAFIDPEGWITLNDLSPEYGIPYTVLKSTDAMEGQYAAHLESRKFTIDTYTDTLPAVMFYGSNIWAGIDYPWAKRVKKISFNYKYKPNGIDSGAFYFVVGYKNKQTGKYVQNGVAYFLFAKKVETYTKVELPVYYNSNNKCDTVVIAFMNSIESRKNRHKPGTILLIDDIDTEWEDFPPIRIASEPDLQFGVYPNPATDIIQVKGLSPGFYKAKIIDMMGKIVLSENITDDNLDIDKLKPGFYHLYIQSNDGSYSGTNYFIKR